MTTLFLEWGWVIEVGGTAGEGIYCRNTLLVDNRGRAGEERGYFLPPHLSAHSILACRRRRKFPKFHSVPPRNPLRNMQMRKS